MFFKKNENKLIKELEQEIELLTNTKDVYQLAFEKLEIANEELQKEVYALKLKEAGYKERLKYASDKEVEAIEMANESAEESLLRQEAYDRLGKKFEEVCQKLSVEEEQNKRWEQEMGRLQEEYNGLKREYRKLQEAIPRKPQPTATIKVDTKDIQEMLENYLKEIKEEYSPRLKEEYDALKNEYREHQKAIPSKPQLTATIKVDTKEIQEMLENALQEIKEEYSPRLKEEPEYTYWIKSEGSSEKHFVSDSPYQLLRKANVFYMPYKAGILTLSESLIEMVTRKKPKDVIIETYSETPVEFHSTRFAKTVKITLCRELVKGGW